MQESTAAPDGLKKHDCEQEQRVFAKNMRRLAETSEKVDAMAKHIDRISEEYKSLNDKVEKHRADFVRAYRSQRQQGINIQLALDAVNATVTAILGDMQFVKPHVESLNKVKTKFDTAITWANRACWIVTAVTLIALIAGAGSGDIAKAIFKVLT